MALLVAYRCTETKGLEIRKSSQRDRKRMGAPWRKCPLCTVVDHKTYNRIRPLLSSWVSSLDNQVAFTIKLYLHSLRESSRKHLTFSRDYSSRMNEEGDTLWIENSKAACGSLVLKRFSRAVGCCSHYACTVRPDGNTCRSDIISQTRLRSASD